MGHHIIIAHKERERAALLQLVREIVAAADQTGRLLSPGEDAMVTEFVSKAQALEREINHLQRDQKRAIPSKHQKAEDA